jgi:hypothetical protein
MRHRNEVDEVTAANMAVCTAFGINPYDVREVIVHMKAQEAPQITVLYSRGYLVRHSLDESSELAQFKLVPIEEVEADGPVSTP